MNPVKLYDVLWMVKKAGPSPYDNRRTELYFAGCQKALSGNPCKNCFNPKLWNSDGCREMYPEDIVTELDKQKIPKYITIVGGEPTDQLSGLIDLIHVLKQHDYHIMLFTWRDIKWIKDHMDSDTLSKVDILVTDPYIEEKRIYNPDLDDGIHNVIGSGNQLITVHNNKTGISMTYPACDVKSLVLDKDNNLTVELMEA